MINELKPILGLELTATPQVERAGGADKFKNVVYEYSLAKAIRDGFVKEPAIATRRNFDPKGISDEELDRIKLEGERHREPRGHMAQCSSLELRNNGRIWGVCQWLAYSLA